MASRCRTVTIVLGAAALAGFGWAEEPAADPVLEALVAEALERNPELVALRESLQGARERPAQARALPDPMLSVLYTNDGWSPSLGERDMTTLAFMASQALPRRGVRGLRAAIAEREVDLAEQQLERARLSVAADVKRAYYALALRRERLELVREQERIWRQIEGVARARYAVGQRMLPGFAAHRTLWSPALMGVGLTLLMLGCLVRVSTEILAYEGYAPWAWSVLQVSGVIELVGT